MARTWMGLTAGVLVAGASTLPLSAQGLLDLHDLRVEGGRQCIVGHFHQGSGSGTTKQAAEISAMNSWGDFTAWEYGREWGNFRISASRSMSCAPGLSGWTCNADARPCRALSSGKARPAPKRR